MAFLNHLFLSICLLSFYYNIYLSFLISFSKISGDLGQDIPQQRKRKVQSRSPSLEEDVDEEERIAAEESARILRSKKVFLL